MREARILIVDDQSEIHNSFKELLSSNTRSQSSIAQLAADIFDETSTAVSLPSYRIDSAFSGEEAFAMVVDAFEIDDPYSLIFMDMRMPPGWDGLETTQKIWEKIPDVEIVICSAYSEFKWGEIQESVGITDHLLFVKKPFDVVEMQQMTYALTEKWRMARELDKRINTLEHVAQQSTTLQNLVFQAGAGVNESDTSHAALQKVIDLIISEIGWDIGHALVVKDNDALRLESAHIWRADIDVSTFKEVSFHADYFAGSGLPGRVLEQQSEVWGASIDALQYSRHIEAERFGMRWVYAFPVMVKGAVPAVLEFFSSQEKVADIQLREGLLQVMKQLGCSFERHLAIEALIKEQEKAECANRAKSNFLANMSHEIRTPITGIIGFTDFLLESDLTRENRNAVEIIQNCSDTLLSLVDDILDLSKIESGGVTFSTNTFFLDEIVYDAVDIVRSQVDERNIELLVSVDTTQPELQGSATHIRQIIMNILNSAFSLATDGDIEVVASIESQVHTETHVTFSVVHKGVYLKDGQLAALFQPYEHAKNSGHGNLNGTGLGLVIGERLTRLMGGTLQVSSSSQEGTHFSCMIPVECVSAAEPVVVCDYFLDKQVVIVDAHPGASQLLKEQLIAYGCTVWAYPDLESSREKIAHADIDLLLLSSSTAIESSELYKNSHNKNMKTVLVLAGAKRDIIVDGYDGYIFKPVRPRMLYGLLKRLWDTSIREASPQEITHDKPCSILLVEDNVVSQRLISELLTQKGHSVKLAEDGIQAVEMAKGFSFDLIFMDMELPRLGGIEAVKKIRTFNTGVPIVALTANAYVEDRNRCLQAGMNDYISKPLHSATVLNIISHYCGEAGFSSRTYTRRILIVEDDRALRTLLVKKLTYAFTHIAIREADDGVDACVQLGSFLPHLIIMDISMPNMDGLAVINYVRGNPQFNHSKIMVITGLDSDSMKIQSVQALNAGHIYYKPLVLEDFFADVHNLLEQDTV
jgi:CheY-like chemotaxis protein